MSHGERLLDVLFLEARVRGLQNQRMAWLSRRNRRRAAPHGNNPLAALFRPIVNPRPAIREAREAERVLPELQEALQISASSSSSSESEDEDSRIYIGEVLNILSFKIPSIFNRRCFSCDSEMDLVYLTEQGVSTHLRQVYCRSCLDRKLKRKKKPTKAAADSTGTYDIHSNEVKHNNIVTEVQYKIGDKIRPAENFYSVDGI